MTDWNKNFQRQIWKHLGEGSVPEGLEPFLQSISDTYDNHEKENKLLNRIMDLSSEELFDANAELRKRNEELDRFVYSTSHDLRAPLTSILGLLQLISLSKSTEDTEKYLKLIKHTTEQLDDFIQDIVNYTHNKKSEIEYSEIDISSLIDASIEKLSFMANASSIKKVINVKSDASFFSDVQRLNNLISNLISNSIKYADTGRGPFIKIDVEVNKEQASIKVEDNGIGIRAEHLDKIFNMFYRASANSKGSGIGLYIVKEITEKLHGTISVESELNRGSIFKISLPNNTE